MEFQKSSEIIWFESGIENANKPDEKRIRKDLMSKGLSDEIYDICFLYGTATQTANQYYESLEKHVNNIDGLFFPLSNKRKTHEALALNDLGIAEKILFSPAEYINMNSKGASDSYKNNLLAICNRIEKSDTAAYNEIREERNKSKNKLNFVGKEFLKMYAGFDITSKTEHPALDWECHLEKGSKEGLISLKRFTENNPEFKYANEFLINHIFEPINRFKKTFDFSDPAYQNYILARSIVFRSAEPFKLLGSQLLIN
jgi:hypothetical protein